MIAEQAADDGVTVEMTGGVIDAGRWAKSVGLPAKCLISASLVDEGVGENISTPHYQEAVAALCMAILDRVKRLWIHQTDAQLRFMFKAGAMAEEIELEAIFLTRGTGELQLVVKRVSA